MAKNNLLPMTETDKADELIKRDKRRLSIMLIIGMFAIGLVTLTMFITYCVLGNVGAAFGMLFAGVLIAIVFYILIMIAHNTSRRTAALLKLTEVVTGEEPISEELLDEVIKNRQLIAKSDDTNTDSEVSDN